MRVWTALLLLLLVSSTAAPAAGPTLDKPALAWVQTVLDRWGAACRDHLHTAVEPLPWVIFYDDRHAWHLNPEKDLLPPHEAISTPLVYAGKPVGLARVAHDAGLWVPGRAALPVKPAAVAMPYADDKKSFCIVPLPALYRKLAPADQAPALDELFLGVACHELTHTRQLAGALRQIERLRARYAFPESFDDNLIEATFGANEEYKRVYEEERGHLSRAIMAEDLDACRRELALALAVSQRRKERFFVGEKEGWSELEDVFLGLEGVAMWVQYRTARDRAPAGEAWLTTLIRLSEQTGAWSQEEGLGLFLLIDRLVPGWQARFLAPDYPSPFAVLREAVGERAPARPAPR